MVFWMMTVAVTTRIIRNADEDSMDHDVDEDVDH